MKPGDSAELVRAAEQLFGTGDRTGAIEKLEAAIVADPNCHSALRSLAILLSPTDPQRAVQYAERALRLQPHDLGTLDFVANYCLVAGRLEEAAGYFRKAVTLNPQVARFHQGLGMALIGLAQEDAAEAPFRHAISLEPKGASRAYAGLAQILDGRGDLKSAAALLRKAYECEPQTAYGKFNLAQALIHENNPRQAEVAYREAISIDPNFSVGYCCLGQLVQTFGRFEEAETLLAKSIDLEPTRGAAYTAIALGRNMTEQDRPFIERVRSALKNERLLPSDESGLHFALAKTLNDLGEYEEALKEYDAANRLMERVMLQGRRFDPAGLKAIYEQVARVFTKEFFTIHRHLGSESDKPIFIVGMMRSGTTLVEQIVSSHPEVGAGGEIKFWANPELGIIDPTGRISGEKLKEVQSEYLDLLERVAPRKARVADKLPTNYNTLGLIHLAFPRARIIHCKRDPADTVLSIYMTPNSRPVPYGYVRENIVFAYKQYRRLMKLYKSVLPKEAILDVQYEQMVEDREAVTRRIIAFLGLDWNDACLHYEDNARVVNTPTLWQARQPIYNTAVKRWKKYEPWLGAFAELVEED